MRSPHLHRRLAALMIVVAAASLPMAYALHEQRRQVEIEVEQLSRTLAEYKVKDGQGWNCRGVSISPSAPLR
jgi:hypothetical protein